MLRMGASSSSTAAPSPHYQPCCSYYALTSSALIKINVLRYHFMFFLLFPLLSRPRKRSFFVWTSTEPICRVVAVWEFIFSFHPDFLCFSQDCWRKKNNKSKSFSTDFPGCPIPSCLLGYLTICVDWGCDVKRAARTYVTDSRSAENDSRRRVTRRLDKLRGK